MVLGFTQTYDGKPTNFIEKIGDNIKIHTLREDKNDRWKQGRLIQFSTGVRTKKYKQHYEKVCTGIQNVHITLPFTKIIPFAADMNIYINGELLNPLENHSFILNDGFTNELDFMRWFFYEKKKNRGKITWKQKTDTWRGKIIHWTQLRYQTNNPIVVQNSGQHIMFQCD